MMAELKANVLLKLKDLFSGDMKKAAGAAGFFASKTIGAFDGVDKAISGTGAKLAAFGLTLSVGAAAKGVIEMDQRMTRLGISANASADEVSKLKRAIFDAAQMPDIKVDPSGIIGGIETIISKTNDLQFAQDNIRNIGLAIQATGESGESMAEIFSQFNLFKYTSEQISSLMDDMVAQSNQGAFSLGEFAKAAPQIFSNLNANGLGTAPEDIRKVNAALQIINAGTKNPTKALAGFNSVLGDIYKPENWRGLNSVGVKVKDSAGNFRDLNDIMLDIAANANNSGNMYRLNKIFGESSMQAIRSYISHGERLNETLSDLGDTEGLLQKQSERMAGTMQSNIQNLQTAFSNFADSNLTKPLEKLTELLNKLSEDPERLQKVFKNIAIGIGAIATVKGLAGISRLVGSLLQLKGKQIDIGSVLGSATAMPVYVTNWGGGGGIPGMGGSHPEAGAGSPYQQTELNKRTSANIKPAQVAGAGAIALISSAAVKIPEMMNELKAIDQNEDLTAKERATAKGGARGDATGSIVGATGGAVAGTLLGAIAASALAGTAIGTAVPGLGNIAGLLIGGAVGAAGFYFGGKAGRKIGEGIGAATAADDGTEEGQSNRRGPVRPGYRTSAARRQQIPTSSLPPQITQTGSNVSSQKVELDGKAELKIGIDWSGERPTFNAKLVNNSTPFFFDTGSRVVKSRSGI
jgi:hypothetical protein